MRLCSFSFGGFSAPISAGDLGIFRYKKRWFLSEGAWTYLVIWGYWMWLTLWMSDVLQDCGMLRVSQLIGRGCVSFGGRSALISRITHSSSRYILHEQVLPYCRLLSSSFPLAVCSSSVQRQLWIRRSKHSLTTLVNSLRFILQVKMLAVSAQIRCLHRSSQLDDDNDKVSLFYLLQIL